MSAKNERPDKADVRTRETTLTGDQSESLSATSVPANILIAGEYAVLEEGGLGIAIAVDARANAMIDRGQPGPPRIEGNSPAGTFAYPGDNDFLSGLVGSLQELLGWEPPADATIRIDTGDFFHEDGTKRGFGSSAATAVLLTAIAMGSKTTPESVAPTATTAHRAAQGGRGSGYDVWASSLGGTILFTGGTAPAAERIELPWLERVILFRGPEEIRTPGAVTRYREWKTRNPVAAVEFLRESNEAVRRLASAMTVGDATEALRSCRLVGIDLGEAIGVSAEITPRPGTVGDAWKSVGAGNELGVALVGPDDPLHKGESASSADTLYQVSVQGLVWE